MPKELNAITGALDRLTAALQKGPLDYIHIATVLLTFGVLIWYTMETYRLRRAGQAQTVESAKLFKEAQRQNEVSVSLLGEAQRRNEVSVMPILAVAVEPVPDRDVIEIALVNVGLGPAFNVSIDPLEWGSGRLQIEHENSVLRPGQRDCLRFHFAEGDSGNLLDAKTLWRWINAHRMPAPLNIRVRCDSVNSIAYGFVFMCVSHGQKLRITYEGITS